MGDDSVLKTVAKLFAHGLLFSIVSTLFTVVIALSLFGFALAGLIFGGFLGFLLVVIVLFVLIAAAFGFANSIITRLLWFHVERGFGVYLAQGLVLFIVLIFVQSIPIALISFAVLTVAGTAASVPTQIILTLAFSPVTGWAGRWIAGRWRVGPRPRGAAEYRAVANPLLNLSENNPGGKHCPRCGGTRLVVASDGSAFCIDCQKGIVSL